ELEALIAVCHESIQQADSPVQWLPTFEMRMAEGAFGAGVGASSDWDNRWDLGMQMRWNIADFVRKHAKRAADESQARLAHLSAEDVRGKLVDTVRAARATTLSGLDQRCLAEEQIRAAQRFHELARLRLEKHVTKSHTEVLQSLQALTQGRLNYINAVRAYDKAQLQLMILLGPDRTACPPPSPGPASILPLHQP